MLAVVGTAVHSTDAKRRHVRTRTPARIKQACHDEPDEASDDLAQPTSTALVPAAGSSARASPPTAPGAINFFAQTPGMVTVDRELYERMAAVYYSQGAR